VDADRTLVAEAAAGSRVAFDELVRRYQVPIHNLVRILTRGDAESEDLVQEAFVRAFRGVARFRGDSSFRTWLYRIALNVVKSHLGRRGRRLASGPLPSDDEDGEREIERVPSGEDLEAAVARRQLIDRALAALPEELRTVIMLRDVQGLEYQEIAALTGVPIGTVESRIFRARQRLRPMLEPLLGRSAGEAPGEHRRARVLPITGGQARRKSSEPG
jgi:RNA polymerase sigma-70 factor (ECF subfamily)